MNKYQKLQKLIDKKYQGIVVSQKDDCVLLTGLLDDYQDIVAIGRMAAKTKWFYSVINEIKLKGYAKPKIKSSSIRNNDLDGEEYDCLVIGGGIVGCSILRELTKYNLKVALVEKEEDVAMHASSRNDGCIHVGMDLEKKSKKLHYLQRSVKEYKELAKQLDVEYREDGQTVVFKNWKYLVGLIYLKIKSIQNKIPTTKIHFRKGLFKLEPNLDKDIKFGVYYPTGACICPYNMVIALAESAIINGAKVYLNTIVEAMDVSEHKITKVLTNRGTIKTKCIINAAGVFADDIAEMAEDKFFSIHPRKGTNSIMDKSTRNLLTNSALTVYGNNVDVKKNHSKGGGVMPTIDDNILVGPDAIETIEKEDFATSKESIDRVFKKHMVSTPRLNKTDIITYFSGIRAANYEEDFIVCKGKWTTNIVHAAAIQSPGLTAAPAIAEDVVKFALEIVGTYSKNENFNPIRKGIIVTRKLDSEARNELIKNNPDYGQVVCRCEEISKGEIIDCLHRPLEVNSVDGIKRRVRAGMGRCQGGFCQPLVLKIISEEKRCKLSDIYKKGEGKIVFFATKGGNNEAL